MDSIFHRISVRRYEDKQVEKEKLMQILRAGMQAPSACNQQPWEFYVVTNPEKIKALSKATPYAGCAANAPVVIVPVYRKEGLIAPDFAQIDLSIAQENMWLKRMHRGLAVCGSESLRWKNRWRKFISCWSCQKRWRYFPCLRSDIRRKAARRKIASIRSGFIFWSETEFECGREPCQEPMMKTFKNGEQHDNSIML